MALFELGRLLQQPVIGVREMRGVWKSGGV